MVSAEVETITAEQIKEVLQEFIPNNIDKKDILFVCIGTDRLTGDALGPLVGTKLVERRYKSVLGTLDNPVHATNLEDTLSEIDPDTFVIAIDACLGAYKDEIGCVVVNNIGIGPGNALYKKLPSVGNIGIKAIVNASLGYKSGNHTVLSCTRLSVVMSLADRIVQAIDEL